MIENVKYEDILQVAHELSNCCNTLRQLVKDKELVDLEDFISTVDVYYKYLQNIVSLYKDADEELEDFLNR